MKVLAVTNRGLEPEAQQEIKFLFGKNSTAVDQGILFEADNFEQIAEFCYRAQTVERVMLLLSQQKQGKDVWQKVKKDLTASKTLVNAPFEARCIAVDDVGKDEEQLGAVVKEATGAKVDLTKPVITVLSFSTDDVLYVGLDFTFKDFYKRDYKVFPNKESPRGSIAAALLFHAGFKDKQTLLDPYCKSGEIIIEAGMMLMGKSSHQYHKEKFRFLHFVPGFAFDKVDKKVNEKVKAELIGSDKLMNNVHAAKKNAKIAGVEKQVRFTRIDTEWLDTKCEKHSVDHIITKIPEVSRINEKEMQKEYKEFFYQAEYILKPKGKVTLLCRSSNLLVSQSAAENGFTTISTRQIWMGKEAMTIHTFLKNVE